jgi:hypothetical protein
LSVSRTGTRLEVLGQRHVAAVVVYKGRVEGQLFADALHDINPAELVGQLLFVDGLGENRCGGARGDDCQQRK